MPESVSSSNPSAHYKRWFDLSLLVPAHLLLFPIWASLWAAIPFLIWLEDRKSVFYRQKRIGNNGKLFNVIKFRTMVIDAEEQGLAWTTDDDPRVIRVGRILRRTALDELPQVTCIWKGDMSFVSPRPLDLNEHYALEELIPGFEKRLHKCNLVSSDWLRYMTRTTTPLKNSATIWSISKSSV